jgi:hypothetical protein
MPRDFEYYTGVVFEFEIDGETWGRGGRYAPGGAWTPETACGLALEISRLAARVTTGTRAPVTVGVVPAGPADFARAMDVALALHRAGVPAALAGQISAGPLSVSVEGDRLAAHTPEGRQEIAALDELVGLLVQVK